MNHLDASPFVGRIGVARRDITPPVGIYARNWGAARHNAATGIHRPLTATALVFQGRAPDEPLVLIAADLGWYKAPADELLLRQPVLDALRLHPARLLINLSHTHAGPSLCTRTRGRAGEELVEPFVRHVAQALVEAAIEASATMQPASLDWAYGLSTLAQNRDMPDPANPQRLLVGYNPAKAADHTLLVGRICDTKDRLIATIANYACHPTTLAWENQLISPDFAGAMREIVEQQAGGVCAFLQGASGDLAPAAQYTGDCATADRLGRSLGHSILAALESMPPPRTVLRFNRAVPSGADLAQWTAQPASPDDTLAALQVAVPLSLKPQPELAPLELELEQCRDAVAAERLFRKIAIARYMGSGSTFDTPLWLWRIGGALLVAHPNEAYSRLQMQLRGKWAGVPVAVMNLTNGGCGYLVPRDQCRPDLYCFWQSPFAQGAYEALEHAAMSASDKLMSTPRHSTI